VDTDLPVGIQLRQGRFHSDCPQKAQGEKTSRCKRPAAKTNFAAGPFGTDWFI
jgi:hypothetical protein